MKNDQTDALAFWLVMVIGIGSILYAAWEIVW